MDGPSPGEKDQLDGPELLSRLATLLDQDHEIVSLPSPEKSDEGRQLPKGASTEVQPPSPPIELPTNSVCLPESREQQPAAVENVAGLTQQDSAPEPSPMPLPSMGARLFRFATILRMRVNQIALRRAQRPAARFEQGLRPRPSRAEIWRKRAIGSLLVIVGYLGMVVKAELAVLPEHAFEGAWLRARLSLAPVLSGAFLTTIGSALRVTTADPKTSPLVHRRTSLQDAKARRFHKQGPEQAIPNEGKPVLVEARLKPLQPFRIEVLDGHKRRVFDSRPTGVDLDVVGNTPTIHSYAVKPDALGNLTSGSDSAASVVLRAIIGKDGRPEYVWKVSGPAELTDEAVHMAREARFGPYLSGGVPVEMEAILTFSFPTSGK